MDNFLSKLKSLSTKSNPGGISPPVAPPLPVSTSKPLDESDASPARFIRRKSQKPLKQFPKLNLPGGPRQFLRQYWPWLAVAGVAGGISAGVVATQVIDRSLPKTADISTFVRDGTLTIKAADGTPLQQLGPATREKLTFEQLPPLVVKAFVAAEDRRFYQHSGVDYRGVVRAIASNLLAREMVEGGSTITQQLARIVFLNQDRTLWRKAKEALLAQKIERELDKQAILEKYLNLVYLGSGAYGVADAAWVYYSKTVDQLTLAEMAMIAGLPPAPSEYSPLVNPQAAKERRDIVLSRMAEAGYITPEEARQASAEPLQLKPSTPKNLASAAPYFTSYIQKELPKYVSKEEIELGGLTVETTLNPIWQKAAADVVQSFVSNEGSYQGFSQASLVAIDPSTGEIRSMVGGTDFNKSQFNRATQAQRQPGSTFKAILYATAIATGMSPWDGYQDAPFKVDGYQPQNANRKYSGWLSLRDALTNSVNVISVKLIMDVGFEPVIQMAHNMGIKSKLIPAYSLALGTSEVNLLELTNAFSTLAAQGVHIEAHGIRRILNRKGQVIYDSDFKVRRVLDKNSASIITWMMEGVVNSGTGQAAQLDRPVAGKTGTSEQARDLWFIGFIPQLAVGVWLGNDDNSPTWSASSTAAAAWHEFMKTATRGMPIQDFPELPRLEGRKGSIKAKPIKSARVQSARPLSDDREYDNSGSYYRDRDESYSKQDSRNTDSGNSESTGSSPESAPSNPGTESSTPVPVAPPSAPPDLPMPPPINTAPPAPVQPAPAAPPAEPSPVPSSN